MQARRRLVICLHALAAMNRIPFWLKVAYTAFVAIIIRPYVRQYGWRNFLWFSDIALFATAPALWLESPLLISMQAVSVTVPETGWTADLVARQVFRMRLIGLADYMFDRRIPRSVRALSLFHLWLPPLLLWSMGRLGYDRRAFRAQTVLTSIMLVTTYAVTEPADDINWVFGLSGSPQRSVNPQAYLLFVMLIYPIAFYWPAHAAFSRLFPNPSDLHHDVRPRVLRRSAPEESEKSDRDSGGGLSAAPAKDSAPGAAMASAASGCR